MRNIHHITSIIDIVILGMETPKKPKMGKPVQQSDIDFIMRKYGMFTITANSPKLGKCSTPAEPLGKSQLNPSTLLRDCMTCYMCVSVRLLYRIRTVTLVAVRNGTAFLLQLYCQLVWVLSAQWTYSSILQDPAESSVWLFSSCLYPLPVRIQVCVLSTNWPLLYNFR